MADYMATAKKLLEDQTKKANEDAQKAIDETNKQTDERIASAEASTQELLKQTDEDYIDAINAADLQKELDLRNIRETRANMGLSRSGLSSTEQTAAILSAGNKTAAAQRQRQAAIDTLKKSLADYKIQQEDSRRSGILSIEQSANDSIAEYGQKVYADAYDAQVAERKEQNRAAEAEEKTRQSILKALWNNNAGSLDEDVYITALEKGWSASNATAYQKNKDALGSALKNGEITQEAYDNAIANGYTADSVIAAEKAKREYQSKLDTHKNVAKQLMYGTKTVLSNGRTRNISTQSNRYDAVEYLTSCGLSIEEIGQVALEIGLSQEDFDSYSRRTTSTSKVGHSTYSDVGEWTKPPIPADVTTVDTSPEKKKEDSFMVKLLNFFSKIDMGAVYD